MRLPLKRSQLKLLKQLLLRPKERLKLRLLTKKMKFVRVVLERLDLQDLPEPMEKMEMTDYQAKTVTSEKMLHKNQSQLRNHALIVHLDRPEHLVMQDRRDRMDSPERPEIKASPESPERRELPDHKDRQVNPVLLELQDNAEAMELCPTFPELQDLPVRPAPLDKPDHPDLTAIQELLLSDHPDPLEMPAHLDLTEIPAHPVNQERTARTAKRAYVIIVRRPAPLPDIKYKTSIWSSERYQHKSAIQGHLFYLFVFSISMEARTSFMLD